MTTRAKTSPQTSPQTSELPAMVVHYFDGRTEPVQATQRELALFEREHGDLAAAFTATPHATVRFLAHAVLVREGRTALDLDDWDPTVRAVLDAE